MGGREQPFWGYASGAMQPLTEREMAAWHAFLRAHATIMRKLEADLQT